MNVFDLRVALFSGNYNYVRDGANKALNRLVGYLLAQGAAVRVYAPVVAKPAFAPTGDLVGVPALPIPFRPEYRIPLTLSGHAKHDLTLFAPNMVHVSAPEILGHSALGFARKNGLPVVASVHTRFETYLSYYRLGFLESGVTALLRRFYRRCDALVTPSESMAELLRSQRMNADISIWSRGVEHEVFSPKRRDLKWRRSLGIGDDAVVVGYAGRLVLEKGLDVFADVIKTLRERGVPHRTLVIGEGPARDWFAEHVPEAIFTGFLGGEQLGRAMASMDMLLNPSVTETFGNVTLEAMSCALPVVGARATGTSSLVTDGLTGHLIAPRDIGAFADAVQHYVEDVSLRRSAGAAGAAVAGEYSWDAINSALAATYLRVIDRRSH